MAVGSSRQRLSIIPGGNTRGAEMGQRNNDLGRLQPRGVIGIEVGKHDKAGAIEDVGGGYRQHPTFRSGLRRIGVAQRQVRGPESLWDGKGDAIERCDFAPRILQYRKRRFAVTAGRGRRTSSLRRESDKRCAQAPRFPGGPPRAPSIREHKKGTSRPRKS